MLQIEMRQPVTSDIAFFGGDDAELESQIFELRQRFLYLVKKRHILIVDLCIVGAVGREQ